MRIDAHHHIWDLEVRDQPWTAELPGLRRGFTMADLQPLLAEHHIDATIVVQTICVPEETPEMLALAHREPAVAGVVGWVDLTAPDVADRLADLRALPGGDRLVGIRHQVQLEPDPEWLCRTDVRRGLAAVADAGLAYDLIVLAAQLPAAVDTVASVPELRFVLDHGGKPPIALGLLEPWRSHVRELAAAPNVAVKLSGLATEADTTSWTVDDLAPFAEILLDAFGANRVMFGSDWPVCLLAGSYSEIVDAARMLVASLDASQQAQVFGDTAVEWYGLAG